MFHAFFPVIIYNIYLTDIKFSSLPIKKKKLKEFELQSLPHPAYSSDLCQLTSTSSCSLTIFAGKALPQPAGGKKCFPRESVESKAWIFIFTDKQTYFLLAKIY